MPKQVYCAKCGTELLMQLKAIPGEGRVISVVEPHSCDEEMVAELGKDLKHVGTVSGRITSKSNITEEGKANLAGPSEVMFEEIQKKKHLTPLGEAQEESAKKAKVAALFDEFPFVKKLNRAAKEHEVPEAPGDKRDKKHLREELQTSSAPSSLRVLTSNIVGETKTENNRQLEEPEDENA